MLDPTQVLEHLAPNLNHIAMDQDRTWWAYDHEPKWIEERGKWKSLYGDFQDLKSWSICNNHVQPINSLCSKPKPLDPVEELLSMILGTGMITQRQVAEQAKTAQQHYESREQ